MDSSPGINSGPSDFYINGLRDKIRNCRLAEYCNNSQIYKQFTKNNVNIACKSLGRYLDEVHYYVPVNFE